jgi:hypothetical protein
MAASTAIVSGNVAAIGKLLFSGNIQMPYTSSV